MVNWLWKVCKIPPTKLKASLYLHDNLNETKAKKFWSTLTGIPLEQFTKSYIVKNNPYRLRKVKHIYGVLKIRMGNVVLHRKMMGWISGVFK